MINPDGIDPLLLDANLASKLDPDRPPKIWVDMLTGLAPKITRTRVTGKRGSAKYALISGGEWNFPTLQTEQGPEDADERHHDPRAWAIAAARTAWRFVIEWSAANGRPADVQLLAETFDEKSGTFKQIGVKAKNIPDEDGNPGLHAELAGQGEARILAWVIVQQQTALQKANDRGDRVYGELEALLSGLGKGMDLAFKLVDKSIADREAFSASAAAERKEQRDFVQKLLSEKESTARIEKLIDSLGPVVEEFVDRHFSEKASEGTERLWQKRAIDLIASFEDAQRKACAEAGIGDDVSEILRSLEALSRESDRDAAKAIMINAARRMIPINEKLRPIFSEEQGKAVRWLLRFSGVPL